MAAERDYIVEKGATFKRVFQLKDGNGVAIDITGADIKSDLRVEANVGGTVLASLAVGTGITITDGPGGEYEYVLTQAQTLAITYCGFYDIFILLSGEWFKLQFGAITLTENITALP